MAKDCWGMAQGIGLQCCPRRKYHCNAVHGRLQGGYLRCRLSGGSTRVWGRDHMSLGVYKSARVPGTIHRGRVLHLLTSYTRPAGVAILCKTPSAGIRNAHAA